VMTNNIAAWAGSQWSPIGIGTTVGADPSNPIVYSLGIYNGQLIVGGMFTGIAGQKANHIAAWGGSTWSPLGLGTNGNIEDMAECNGRLIVGGEFDSAGGMPAKYIAAWNGSTWSPLGSGMGGELFPSVSALTVYDNKLIAAGKFQTAGGVSAKYIAAWDGSYWSPLGSGMDWVVEALAVYDNKLIAGGYFSTAGGIVARNIASWDGSAWSPLGSGINSWVYALTVYNNRLMAAGSFDSAGGQFALCIAAWDGSSWSPLGGARLNPGVNALAVYDNKLFAAGSFNNGIDPWKYTAIWDGSSWNGPGSGINLFANALTVYDNSLIVGGYFTIAGGKVSAYLAQWTKQGQSAVDEQEAARSLNWRLSQNHPNPFNPSTTVEYTIPRTSRVIIAVYNIVGQKVKTLLDAERVPGTYSITWDGTDERAHTVASGVYLYRISAGDYIETKQMVLIK